MSEASEVASDFLALFKSTYPTDCRMPFQGAWPIDLWALEETAFTYVLAPAGGFEFTLWWRHDVKCSCGNEPEMSYQGVYYCRKCFKLDSKELASLVP